MRNFFLILLGTLIGFTQIINYKTAGKAGVPLVYWVADGSTYRQAQFKAFKEWQKRQNLPPFELRLDPANSGAQKFIVQGVTGVAGDIVQIYGADARYFAEIGLLEDLGPMLAELGISTNYLPPAFKELMVYEGKIVSYPANAAAGGIFCVNRNALQAVGMEKLPTRWDFDTFETLGKEYVKRANVGSSRLRKFFANNFNMAIARNSLGISTFNETLTGPAFNLPAYAQIIKRSRKWVVEDRIVPTKADMESFTSEGDNYGGSSGLLHRGSFAMVQIGRWHFSTTRFMSGNVEYVAMPHPDGGFQNHILSGRSMSIYKGSPRKDLAKYFFKWLASEDYQKQIVGDADGDPPDQRFLNDPGYLRPEGHSNEWAFNSRLAELSRDTAVPQEFTPFAVATTYQNPMAKVYEAYFSSGIGTPESVLTEQERLLKKAIVDYLGRHQELKARFDEALETQKKIDALKASGKKIPLALVANPFLRVYYQKTGRGE